MQKKRKQFPTITVVLTTILFVVLSLIAVIGCEEQPTESDPDPVDNSTAPGMVIINDISDNDINSNSIEISWEAPDAGKNANGTAATITGYKVYYKADDTVTESDGILLNKDNAGKGIQTATITDLAGLTKYAFIVITINSENQSSTSAVKIATTLSAATAPLAASINTIDATDLAQVTANTITISWTEPADAGKKADGTAATITGYKVYYKVGDTVTESDGILLNEDNAEKGVQTATTATITDLAGLTKYAFIVITINSENQSSTSEMQTTTTLNASSDPSAVTINTIDATDLAQVTANTITISWTEPAEAGKKADGTAATITGYKVYYKAGDTVTESDGILLNKDNAGKGIQTATTATITDLAGLTKYAFIVITINSENKSSTSAVKIATTLSAATAPAAASINTIDATDLAQVTANTITISWTEPADAGKKADGTAATITGYKVYYKAGDTVKESDGTLLNKDNAEKGVQTATTATITDLAGLTKYAFIVITINSENKSSASEVQTTISLNASSAPSAANINTIDATDLAQVTANTITISWSAPSDAGKKGDGTAATITGYSVYYQVGTEVQMSTALSTTISTSTSTTITSLQGLTQYAIVVVATNSAGLTSTSATLTATTLVDPNAPSTTTLMPSAIANTFLGLVWAVPSNAGKESDGTNATISSYKVFYKEGTSLDYSSATKLDPSNTTATHINGREVVITGLTMNTQYTIGVRTTNSAGATSDSNPVTLSTKNYTKLGADGSILAIQNGTWSYDSSGNDNGTESAGTLWSCVRDEGTGLVWEVKTNKATADARDKDLTYQWGGLTAIGRDDTTNREGSYYDEWNTLVLHANDQQLTSATDDGDAIEANADPKTVLCGTSTNSGNNWRVPSLMELSTISNYNVHSPAYDATMFPNGKQDRYWSSSPHANDSNYAWSTHFGSGYDLNKYRTVSYYVRLVRGSQ